MAVVPSAVRTEARARTAAEARAVYATSALRSLPRLLTLLDRNPFSPTYGCFHRDYWLYKTSDFPDAVRQFGTHALALAYAHEFPGIANPYARNARVRDWAIAALDFWTKIQHTDGSFDEFYPYERGWVGPTAFTTYAAAESFRILRDELTPDSHARVVAALRRAAAFIGRGEHEEDHLANHHAMAVLAVATVADLLADPALSDLLPSLWKGFLAYQHAEGWSREYDGPDPGYLSATISFLAKAVVLPTLDGTIRRNMREVLTRAVEFASYFLFPDGTYGGSVGSRNTTHLYPHGFEILARRLPLAASIAERAAQAIAEGRAVSPDIMSDRYVHYRVPEYLLAARDAAPRPALLAQLPYERPPFVQVFAGAGIVSAVHGPAYTVVSLRKGGTIVAVHRREGRHLLRDTGWAGRLAEGTPVTAQAPTELSAATRGTGTWEIRGHLGRMQSAKLFTLWSHLAFRIALGLVGRSPRLAHALKGRIRRSLILGNRPTSVTYHRRLTLSADSLTVEDVLENPARVRFASLQLGGDAPARYVPQSRFFLPPALDENPRLLSVDELSRLNAGETFVVRRSIRLTP